MGEDKGFIKLSRKIMQWEWWDDATMVKFFTGLILLANYETKSWHGMTIKRGSFITSISKLTDILQMSKNAVLRCLLKLKDTGEIIDEVKPNQYRLITIVNYEIYQEKQVVPKKDNRRDNNRYNRKDNHEDNRRDTTKEYISNDIYKKEKNSGGVCHTGTHTPPKEENKMAQTSVTPLVGEPSEPLPRIKPLIWSEWNRYSQSKGYSAVEAEAEWNKRNGCFSDEAIVIVRKHNKEVAENGK